MRSLVLNRKESACLLSSDFRSENPLTQTRTFHTQNRWHKYEENHSDINIDTDFCKSICL